MIKKSLLIITIFVCVLPLFAVGDTPYKVLRGHNENVTALALSPDGSYVASADKRIILWKMPQGWIYRPFSYHDSHITALAYTPDGKKIVAGDEKGKITLWSTGNGKLEKTFVDTLSSADDTSESALSGPVTGVTVLPAGKKAVSVCKKGTVRIWDIETGNLEKQFAGHEAAITGLAYLASKKFLLTGSRDKTVKVWKESGTTELLNFTVNGEVSYLAVSSDDSRLACSLSTSEIIIYDPSKGNIVKTLKSENGSAGAVAFSQSGKYLAEAHSVTVAGKKSVISSVNLWNLETGKVEKVLTSGTAEESYPQRKVMFSRDDAYIIESGFGNEIYFWETGI